MPVPDHHPVEREPERPICAKCPVQRGECPDCGTFWCHYGAGKIHGFRPVDAQPPGFNVLGGTNIPFGGVYALPNYVPARGIRRAS